jgi:hypothetical protein
LRHSGSKPVENQSSLGAGSPCWIAGRGPRPADPALLKRRREAIARMLEQNIAYRGILDDGVPRLVEVQLGGPFEYVRRKNLFSSEIITPTHYCARGWRQDRILPARLSYRLDFRDKSEQWL